MTAPPIGDDEEGSEVGLWDPFTVSEVTEMGRKAALVKKSGADGGSG